MHNEKNKNLAALLAFFGGIVGLQRFYLGQVGLGLLMVFFAIFTLGSVSAIIGVIDAIIFLTMSPDKFDLKYNNSDATARHRKGQPRYRSYRRRYSGSVESDPMGRRDRRISRDEYRASRMNDMRKTDGPYRKRNSRKQVPTSKRERRMVLKKIDELKTRGIEKFKDYDMEGSIQEFNKILEIDPHNIAANFNVACAYSQLEKPERAMLHISEAVKAGFDDFERIRKHSKLAYARIQPEWEDFERNGFIYVEKETVVSRETLQDPEEEEDLVSDPNLKAMNEEDKADLLAHLHTLKEQREKGIISETEFELERRKLMSS